MAECLDLLVKKNVCRFIEPGQPMCAVSFNTTSALIFHYFLEHGRYLCNNCTLSFFSMHDLEIHQHSVEQAHESNYWFKKPNSKYFYDLFIIEPVRCGYCGLPYRDMTSVQKHQTLMHNQKDKTSARMGKWFFRCAFCPHVFRQRYQLRNHEQGFHLLVSNNYYF